MTTATIPEQTHITIPAGAAALAWLNAFSAASDAEDRPALCRTLALEFFPEGVQFIGCDGHVLFRTWVSTPEIGTEATFPGVDERPSRTLVVADVSGFGASYMKTLLRVTADEEHALDNLLISTAPADEDNSLTLGPEFKTERLILRAAGQRTDLRLFEGAYPNWRQLRLGLDAIKRVEGLTIASRLLGLVGKLKGVNCVDLEFYGDKRHVAFVARGECEVRGLIMPIAKGD